MKKGFIFCFYLLNCNFLIAQNELKIGTVVNNLPITKTINSLKPYNQLHSISSKLIIVDFFGTWCAPCVKSLPELENFKKELGDSISIFLVSTETENKLQQFLAKRKEVTLPIIVDENNQFSNYFNPPSYPYSIILNEQFTILSITNAKDITLPILQNFIAQNQNIKQEIPTVKMDTNAIQKDAFPKKNNNSTLQLAEDVLLAVKTNENPLTIMQQLALLKDADLARDLHTDIEKTAFWLNIYNAYTAYYLKKDASQFKKRKKFYKAKQINVAGKMLSLDAIEHGILRHSKNKLSLGYFNTIFVNKFEKKHRVNQLDWRIHFALNCGAKSCPPIAFYDASQLDKQLNLSTKNYLLSECEKNIAKNSIAVPSLFSWFRKDFGGKKNILPILKKYSILSETEYPKIRFKKYDWSLYLDNYK
jgi:thiol-disulfide isomerase/thioredoxin